MTTALALPETNTDGLAAIERAKALVIATNQDYLAADAFCVALKGLEKQVDEAYDEHIEAAHKAHKDLLAKKKRFAEPIIEARKIAKAKMGAWEDERERQRLAEEERLRAEAKKKAEDEALAAAEAAQKDGNKAEAEAIINTPVSVAPIVVPKATPKAQTVSRTVWDYRITNPNLIPREYLTVDTVKLGQLARAMKGAVNVPGVEFFPKKV